MLQSLDHLSHCVTPNLEGRQRTQVELQMRKTLNVLLLPFESHILEKEKEDESKNYV